MQAALDYLDLLASESDRFAEAISGAQPQAPVPSCPDWTADDLLWHLGEVQWFWGTIVRSRLQDPAEAEARKPARPPGRDALLAFYQQASGDLRHILAATSPDTEVWTWHSDHTVSFVRRRQAHEALIHRVDAELTAGARTPMDPQLSADGVDEALRVMYGGVPPWGSFTADDAKTVRLQAIDTGGSWLVRLGRFTGTDPDDDRACDEPDLAADAADRGAPAAATVAATAADLDCWLWRRPPAEAPVRSGEESVLAEFDSLIAGGID